MLLRSYAPADCNDVLVTFYTAVHSIKDEYTAAQLDAWAPGALHHRRWNALLVHNDTVVAQDTWGAFAGFGSLDKNGNLLHLYVRPYAQHKGIARAILAELERRAASAACGAVCVRAPTSARAFFAHHGYAQAGPESPAACPPSLPMKKACVPRREEEE